MCVLPLSVRTRWIIVKIPREKSSSDAGVAAGQFAQNRMRTRGWDGVISRRASGSLTCVPCASAFSSPSGTAYLYGDANSYSSPSAFWTNSSNQISDATSAAGRTISQIYAGASNPSNGYMMYNDETPGGSTSESYGHSKGHLAWNGESAFWLIHSVPKYADSPANVQSYVYPSTGEEYGQSMMCLSLTTPNVDQVFLQFQCQSTATTAHRTCRALVVVAEANHVRPLYFLLSQTPILRCTAASG